MSNIQDEVLTFADKYLEPYRISRKGELIPELCPVCHGGDNRDKHSFAINIDDGVGCCKRGSCGWKGRLEDLAELFHENVTINRGVGFRTPKSNRGAKSYELPKVELLPLTETALEYFRNRKISEKTLKEYGVSCDADGNIVFPFYENGELVYVKYRKPKKPVKGEKKEWQCSNTKPILFGMDRCSFSLPLTQTEGQIDALSLFEAGVDNVVSVPCGCDNLEWIENCWTWLEHFQKIILFGDNDDPGKRMIQNVLRRLDESRCALIEEYPKIGVDLSTRAKDDTCKDANEVLYFCGPEKLVEMVENAQPVPIRGVIDLADVTPVDPTLVPRIKTCIPKLDDCIGGLREGGITVFTGVSGAGKSTQNGQLLLNAIEQGHSVCAYSGELGKEDFQEWINLQAAGSEYITLKYDKVSGKDVPFVPFYVQERVRNWYRGKFFLFDNNEIWETNQAESILNVFQMMARRYGCSIFLVDNMMTSLCDCEEETRAQGRFVAQLKKFANYYGVHVIIVAHPRKVKAGETLRKDDVGGSSHIVNLADNAIVVERPNLRIIKNRRGGVNTLIECCYCKDSRRIYQADTGDVTHYSWDRTNLEKPSVRADSHPDYGIQLADVSPF